ALRWGVSARRTLPFVTLVSVALVSALANGTDHVGLMEQGRSLMGFALGWLAFSVKWPKESAQSTLLSLALLPVASVIIGVLLEPLLGIRWLGVEYSGAIRLRGALIAAHLAMLGVWGAYAAVALLYLNRRASTAFWLAPICMLLVGLTVTRG